MTAVRERVEHVADEPVAGHVVGFGTKDDILGGYSFRYKDVRMPDRFGKLGGKTFRVRELSQHETDLVTEHQVKQTAAEDIRNITATVDMTGWMAKRLAFAMVNPDMTPFFANPTTEWEQLNRALPNEAIKLLYDALDSLTPTSDKQRKDLGKE